MIHSSLAPADAPPAGRAEKSEVFKTADGATLVGRLFYPSGVPRAVLVLNGATAVPQDYYQHFASYAAEAHNLIVFTYDYRDMGRSASGSIRRSRATMADWGIADQQAARAKVRRLFPGLPIRVIGHSLGGMTMTLQRDLDDVTDLTCVASGNVHHSDHPWPYRATALLFWFLVGPPVTALAGYLPGKMMGMGEDLPKAAYWQWRRWCTSMKTFGEEAGRSLPQSEWQQPQTQVRFVAFADDDMIPPHAVARLAQDYGRKDQDVEVIAPADFGVKAIGHLGVFARRNRSVWDLLLEQRG